MSFSEKFRMRLSKGVRYKRQGLHSKIQYGVVYAVYFRTKPFMGEWIFWNNYIREEEAKSKAEELKRTYGQAKCMLTERRI